MTGSVQYRIVLGKKDELVIGGDDADLVISVAQADCGLEPTVAYMQGRLKAAGPSRLLFEVLESGAVAEVLAAHAVAS